MINVTAVESWASTLTVFTNESERLVETGSDTEDEMETAMKEESEPLRKVLETSVSPISDDESLSIEEHLAQIPDGMMLPSLTAEDPTKIKFCREIKIRGVEDGDWYKENIPKIDATDKGKKPLREPDTVKGHPAREQFQFICGDIDFLILLREKVITKMTSFFHSFSLRNLKAMQSVKDIFSKEKNMLVWAETDSLKKAVQRRMFIIAKYRELLHKFLVARHTNLVLGQPTTAIDQQILDLLSGAHQQAVRTLLKQMRTHGLQWTRSYSSMLFEEPNIERGFFIPRSHKTIFSTCWIRNLRKVEGSWLVEDGYDRVVYIVPIGPVMGDVSVPRRIIDTVSYRIQIIDVISVHSSDSSTSSTSSSHNQLDSRVNSPMNEETSANKIDFLVDTAVDGETPVTHISLPAVDTTDVTESLSQLRASITRLSVNQLKTSSKIGDLQNHLLFKIKNLEKAFKEALSDQEQVYRNLMQSARQEAKFQQTALSLELLSLRKWLGHKMLS
ncbi:ubiquitin carboxyl-terminal hydrolase 8-like [Dorcoceras hygrometricum]|uniref:Ubiquitin carboxyl-terminal hydrolase 8-like n=1 Tax=Dorcoceras hygrometricum TaxID=472368 RepID=A0A2Z7CCH6_9LAMI|nr:ubiquitin carboxyl-terminal hydrolase 8-like [Dorcoceras hygrometricum]